MYRFEDHQDYRRHDLFSKKRDIQNTLMSLKIDIERLKGRETRCASQEDKNELSWIAHDIQDLNATKDVFVRRKEEIEKQLKNG